jgi:hypothetical protein
MSTDDKVKETVTEWLNGLAANYYDKGIFRLVKCQGKSESLGLWTLSIVWNSK